MDVSEGTLDAWGVDFPQAQEVPEMSPSRHINTRLGTCSLLTHGHNSPDFENTPLLETYLALLQLFVI